MTGKTFLRRCKLAHGEQILLFGGLLLLIVLVFLNNKAPFYDEDDYLRNVPLLKKLGFGKTYLMQHIGSAGPLYTIVHTLLQPLTKLQTPYIRLVNVAFLGLSMYFMALTLNQLQFSRSLALLVMSIPMTYVVGGLALTEMPAICSISAGIYLVFKGLEQDQAKLTSFVRVGLGGLFVGFAIIGRQPYLLILSAFPLLVVGHKNFVERASLLFVAFTASLALPYYVFSTWKGLVAPSDTRFYEQIEQQGISYRPEYFIICLAYYAIIFIIVAPAFFLRPSKTEVTAFVVLFAIISLINYKYAIFLGVPLGYLTSLALGGAVLEITEILSGAALIAGGTYFLYMLTRRLQESKYNRNMFFFALAVVSIALSCIKLTGGFSSRYAAQAIPFLIPLCAFFYKESKWNIYRILTGVFLGLLSYASYVYFD